MVDFRLKSDKMELLSDDQRGLKKTLLKPQLKKAFMTEIHQKRQTF